MNKKKQFIINMIAQVIGFLVNIGISFLLTPFIVKYVGSEAYGFVGLANSFVGYAQVITAALNSMASRFITIKIIEKDVEGSNRYFTSVVIANMFTALAMSIPSVLIVLNLNKIVNISDNILLDVQALWALIFLNFLVSVVSSTYSVATFVRNKLYLSSIQGIIANVLRVLILGITFSLFVPYVRYVGLATLAATTYLFIGNTYYTRKLIPEIKVNKQYFDFKVIKVLLSSGIWNSFARISTILSTGLDLLVTNLYVSSTAMGVLSIAKTVPSAVLGLFSTLASVYAPQLTISFAEKNYFEMKNQLMSSIKFLGMFACIPVAILFAYGQVFYQLWVPTQDGRLLYILTILSCIEFIFVLPLEGIWNLFTAANKVKQVSLYMFVNSLLSIAIVLISIRFVENDILKLYIIAGMSTVFSIIRSLTFLPIYGAHCLRLKWNVFYPAIFKNTVSVIITTVFAMLIDNFLTVDSWSSLVLVGVLTSFFAIGFNLVFLLDKSERRIFLKKIMRN